MEMALKKAQKNKTNLGRQSFFLMLTSASLIGGNY